MKKIYLLFVLSLIVSGSVLAQSFSTSNVYVSGPVFMMEGHASVTNNSSTPKDVKIQRTVNNIVPGHISYFCWVDCYTETVSISPDYRTLSPGATSDDFKAYLESWGISGVSYNTYCFYDMNNPSDSTCVDFIYDATTGMAEISSGKNFISKPYPNPASENTTFFVSLAKGNKSARVKIYNMLGSEVKDFPVTENKNTLKVDVSDLKAGIYFYSLWVNNKSTVTGKLLISKN